MKTPTSWKIGFVLAGAVLIGTLATLPAHAQTYPTLVKAQSPLDYWRFSETNHSPVINVVSNQGSTGAAATGYVLNGALTGQPGIVGNSVRLFNVGQSTGNDTNEVDIPNLPALNPEPPFTVEFWLMPNSPFEPNQGKDASGNLIPDATGLCAVSSDSPNPDTSSRSGYLFYVAPKRVTFYLGGEGGYAAGAIADVTISTNAWTHIVGEFDGTTASVYVNGVLKDTGPTVASFFPNQWVPTRIGGNEVGGDEYAVQFSIGTEYFDVLTGNRGWDGWIDELAVYNTLLSSNTIASHYTAALNNPSGYDKLVLQSNPVGYWNMDEPAYTPPAPSTYTFAADIGSVGDNGTNTYGTLADQPGVPGLSADSRSVIYSGETGSLVLDTNEVAPVFTGTGQQITLAAWIKPTTLGVGYAGDIIAQGWDPNLSENYLRIADTYDWEGNGNPDVTYYEVGSAGDIFGGGFYASAIYPVPPGDIDNWVFLVGTYDGTNWNLYRDATLVAQTSDGGIGPNYVQAPWSIGSRSAPNPYFGFFFPGAISEAVIFTNALDADTISNLYNAVERPPVITQAPQAPIPAYLGSSAAFSVLADGPGTLSYQWLSNNVALTGQTETNLTLGELTAASDATYSVVVNNQYGSVTSSVILLVTPTLPPVTLTPAAETRLIGFPLSFAPATPFNEQLTFQWYADNALITGATQSSYTATTASNSSGSYTLVISNSFGVSTSTVATLSVLTPQAGYETAIVADSPLAYLRLDETSGTTAFDVAGGNNGFYFGNYELGQPGPLLFDPDFATTFTGTTNCLVGGIGATTLNFAGTSPTFSIEAWANGSADQPASAAVIAKGTGNNAEEFSTEQFAIDVQQGVYVFYVNDNHGDTASAIAAAGPDGNWHHLVGVCDATGPGLTLYIDGQVAATSTLAALNPDGIIFSTIPVSIGAERSGVDPVFDWDYKGTIGQVAIYSNALSASQVQAHYTAAFGPNTAPFIKNQPVSATNYVNLPVSLSVNAAGSVPLTYQWNKAGSGPIAGATSNTFTILNLALTDAGTYTCGITNSVAGILSTSVVISVLGPPTSPPSISGLVMHLTFDGNLIDATGRGNDGTNEASGTTLVSSNNYVPGVLGQAYSYVTTVAQGATNSSGTNATVVSANYVSLGVRPDLQFGTGSFTVSMWVQLPANYIGNDLPFFTDVIGSTFSHPGFSFEPSFGTSEGTTPGWPGAWGFSVFDSAGTGEGVYGDVGTINDNNNWHSLIYVMDRASGAVVYLDGLVAHQNPQGVATSITKIGDIDSIYGATIGQDPTGVYPQPGSANIDDLGVWNRALTPLEAAAIYTAGAVSQLSFGGSAPVTLLLAPLPNHQLQLSWPLGSLQSATNLSGPWSAVAGATSPYTVTPTGAQQFYRIGQ